MFADICKRYWEVELEWTVLAFILMLILVIIPIHILAIIPMLILTMTLRMLVIFI